jgi:hypothetical protein
MNSLAEYVRTEADILYPDLAEVPFNDGKPTASLMRNWSLDDRINKFWEFCRAYDQREDTILKENYQQLSHRLHWHECPFVDEMSKITDPEQVIAGTVMFSFTNEHWQMFYHWLNEGFKGVRDYMYAGNRHSRHDLFQIYYPKGTRVEEWIVAIPPRAGKDLKDIFTKRNRPYTMMEFAKILNEYFVTKHGFRNAMYPCKNVARHIAMSHPEWVDPETFLWGGTGFFDGLVQVFDCPHYMSKGKYEIDPDGAFVPLNEAARNVVEHMDMLRDHPGNPIHTQKYLNIEDKLCFFYKHIGLKVGFKKATKKIPYNWVYPDDWSLKGKIYIPYSRKV